MASTAQQTISEVGQDRTLACEARSGTLGPTQARRITTIMVFLIPVLPLFMGGRTPFAPAYLADVFLSTCMGVVLVVLGWPAGTRANASKETKLWIAFAAVLSAYIILQALPIPPIAHLLGPYPHSIWHSGDVHPQTWSPVPGATLLGGVIFLALWIAAYTTRYLPSRYIGYIILAIAASALFQAAYGLLANASRAGSILGLWPRVNPNQVTGTFTNRNLFAGYLALSAPLTIWIWWLRRVPVIERWPTALKATGSVLSGALIGMAVFSSASRLGAAAGTLGVLTATAFWLPQHPNLSRTARRSVYVAVGAGLLAALWYGLAALLSRYVDQGLESSRWDVWSLMLSDLPWQWWVEGVSLGGFEAAFKGVQDLALIPWYDHAHSDLLEWLIEMGFAAVLTLIVALWALRRRAYNTALRGPIYGGLVAIGTVALGDFSWHMSGTLLILACLIGMALRPARELPDPRSPTSVNLLTRRPQSPGNR